MEMLINLFNKAAWMRGIHKEDSVMKNITPKDVEELMTKRSSSSN
ncbi:hypothetical protein [Bacillus sp. T33-2]|nr:hypothetical protein [Bacillus sp. T33-2]